VKLKMLITLAHPKGLIRVDAVVIPLFLLKENIIEPVLFT